MPVTENTSRAINRTSSCNLACPWAGIPITGRQIYEFSKLVWNREDSTQAILSPHRLFSKCQRLKLRKFDTQYLTYVSYPHFQTKSLNLNLLRLLNTVLSWPPDPQTLSLDKHLAPFEPARSFIASRGARPKKQEWMRRRRRSRRWRGFFLIAVPFLRPTSPLFTRAGHARSLHSRTAKGHGCSTYFSPLERRVHFRFVRGLFTFVAVARKENPADG